MPHSDNFNRSPRNEKSYWYPEETIIESHSISSLLFVIIPVSWTDFGQPTNIFIFFGSPGISFAPKSETLLAYGVKSIDISVPEGPTPITEKGKCHQEPSEKNNYYLKRFSHDIDLEFDKHVNVKFLLWKMNFRKLVASMVLYNVHSLQLRNQILRIFHLEF